MKTIALIILLVLAIPTTTVFVKVTKTNPQPTPPNQLPPKLIAGEIHYSRIPV